MVLSDEQILLNAWEVAVRRGWEFVMTSLLRSGVDLGSTGLSDGGVAGLWGEYSQRGKLSAVGNVDFLSSVTTKSDCDRIMASQESDDEEVVEEEEEEEGEEAPCEPSSMESGDQWKEGSWRQLVVHRKSTLSSSKPLCIVDPDLQLRIKLFVSKATTAFNDCFSRKDITRDLLFTCSRIDAQTQTLPTQVSPPKGLQTSTLGPKVVHISSKFAPQSGDGAAGSGFPSVAVVKPTTLTDPAEGFLWPVNLAAHVSRELRERVVALRFFDMFSLLPGWSAGELPVVHRSISNWQKGFSVMGSILLEDAPYKMTGFFNYGEIINKAHDELEGEAWLTYDEEFRKLKEIYPEMNWAIINSVLWPQIPSPALTAVQAQNKPKKGQSSPSDNVSSKVDMSQDKMRPEKKLTKGTCLRYNKGVCMGSYCDFLHLCSICREPHPRVKCPKRSNDGENPEPQKKQQLG